jgi:hypothetical protein
VIWERHVASIWEKINACGASVEKSEGKTHLEDLDLDGWITLK